jgi:hypothetical protein
MSVSSHAATKAWLAIVTIVAAAAVPLIAGIAVAFDPIVDRSTPTWIAISTLESIPSDGTPRRISVKVPRTDAWTQLPDEFVGSVLLRRHPESGELIAWRTTTGGAEWSVEFNAKTGRFDVPCLKDVHFDIDGRALTSIPNLGDLKRVRSKIDAGVIFIWLADS